MNTHGLNKLTLVCGAVVVIAILVASYFIARTPGDNLGHQIVQPAATSGARDEVSYTLPSGRSASDVGKDLQELGVIRSGRQFQLLVSLMGVQDQLSAGDYTLKKNSATVDVINAITVKESAPVVKITFPEGIRIEEMAAIAEKAGLCSRQEFLDAVAQATVPESIAAILPPEGTVPGLRLQGLLFPDTYIVPRGTSPANLVELMLTTFAERFSPELQAAAETHGVTPYQAITLASIVEREAAVASERPLIAGVFYNRLAAGDLLGADPTVQYAVSLEPGSVEEFGYWKKELTLVDLDSTSPYNTRRVAGLPPGPITNPGLASLEAAANPATTKDYYFVADAKKGDGSHVFAETEAQHLQNIAAVGTP